MHSDDWSALFDGRARGTASPLASEHYVCLVDPVASFPDCSSGSPLFAVVGPFSVRSQESEMTFQLSLDIAASPATVFDFVADFTTMPRWYSAVQQVDRIGGTSGLGTRYEVHRQLPGGPARNEVEITNYESGREVTFTSLSGPTPFVYRYLVEPDVGATRLTLEGTISGTGLGGPAALLGPLAEGLFKRGMRDNLGVLKEILER